MNEDFDHRRDGSTAMVPDGTRIYAIGDIHGRMDLLDRLLQDIAADAAYAPYEAAASNEADASNEESPPKRIVIVFMGDLIDRGPDSKGVVERISAGAPAEGPLAKAQFISLRGNHEDYIIQFLADFSVAAAWLRNGGLEAIRSYVGQLPDGFIADYPALQRLLYRAMPPSHLRFFARMPVKHVEGDYLFVHAGIRPGIPLERQDSFDMMWIREPFLSNTEPLPKMVVHGHTLVEAPEIRPNRIAIDTGAYRSGRLTCLVLEGAGRRFIST